jgi:hypothetical protein
MDLIQNNNKNRKNEYKKLGRIAIRLPSARRSFEGLRGCLPLA